MGGGRAGGHICIAMKFAAQNILDALPGVAYVVDAGGIIAGVGRRGWRLFAAEAGALDLADPQSVVGSSLFDFMAGDDVRHAYERIFERLRRGEPHITMPCRCDSPGVVRDMRLSLTPIRHQRTVTAYLFQSITLSERTRPPISLFEFASHHYPETVPMLAMCSMCERVNPEPGDGEEGWMQAEHYYACGGTSQVRISHTICPACFRQWVQGWTGTPPPAF